MESLINLPIRFGKTTTKTYPVSSVWNKENMVLHNSSEKNVDAAFGLCGTKRISKHAQCDYSSKQEMDISLTRSSDNIKGPYLRVCRICNISTSKYTCPQCNAPYCSVLCYQKHNITCTEIFYMGLVKNEKYFENKMTSISSADERNKLSKSTIDILKKSIPSGSPDIVSNNASKASNFENSLPDGRISEKTLARINLDDSSLGFNDLSEDEKKIFLKQAFDGTLGKFVKLWKPWWFEDSKKYYQRTKNLRSRTPLVELFDSGDTSGNVESISQTNMNINFLIIPINRPVYVRNAEQEEKLEQLGLFKHKKPQPTLGFNCLDIIYAYIRLMYSFNGDWREDVLEASGLFLSFSDVLRNDRRYSSMNDFFYHHLARSDKAYALNYTDKANSLWEHMKDLTSILDSTIFVFDLLFDSQMFLKQAIKVLIRDGLKTANKEFYKLLRSCRKKIQFYEVWAKKQHQKYFLELRDSFLQVAQKYNRFVK